MEYINPDDSLSKKAVAMKEKYGFDYDCALCQVEANGQPGDHPG
jgi:hypothetical protein